MLRRFHAYGLLVQKDVKKYFIVLFIVAVLSFQWFENFSSKFPGCRVFSERPQRQREQHPQLLHLLDVPARHRVITLQRAGREIRS